jgi:hypothetical protein
MAISEVNGLAGNMMAEPRVFAHDAQQIVIGAINFTADNSGLKMTSGGSGYTVGDEITLTTPAGTGSSPAKIKVITVDSNGTILTYELIDSGTANKPYGQGYAVDGTADQVSVSPVAGGGNTRSGFTAVVENIDLPYTTQRGACLYIGSAQSTLRVEMESGSDIIFRGVPAGSFMPIEIVRLIDYGTRSTDTAGVYPIIALY